MSLTPAPTTVVIPTHDTRRFATLAATVEAVRAQSCPPAEVIVVVDHNPALYQRIRAELDGVTVLENAFARGVSGNRNTGARHAATPIVVFLDDDIRVTPQWLSRLTAPLADDSVIGAGAAIVPHWQTGRPGWLPEEFLWTAGGSYRGMPTRTAVVRNVWSATMAVRREVFLAVGGFRTGFGKVGDRSRPEDTELCLRMSRGGGHWVYVPQATVEHEVPAGRSTYRYFLTRCYNEGRGKIGMRRVLAGEAPCLDAERGYLTRTLPRAVRRDISRALRGDGTVYALRAGSILAGVAAAGLGAAVELLAAASRSGHRADHHTADLDSADPHSADLHSADLHSAELHSADPDGVGLRDAVAGAPPQAPEEHLPALVADVELTEPLPAIAAATPDGRRIERAWLLIRVCTEPVGSVLLPVGPQGLSSADLAQALWTELGHELRRRGVRARFPAGADEPAFTRDGPSPYLLRRAEVLRDAPPITVVICTREHPTELARCLESVLDQHHPASRVLVVDNAPRGDATREVAARAATRGPVEYLPAPRPGLSHARNVAVAAAPGEYLAWIDDDEVADPYWVAELARAFVDHPDADVVSGVIVPGELTTDAQLLFEEFGGHSKGRGFTPAVFAPATAHRQSPLYPLPPFGTGGNMAFRPGVIERIGGFDTALGAGSPAMGSEDTLAFTQVLLGGGTIVYHPGALVRHYHRRDLAGLRRQLVGYGTGLTAAYTSLLHREPALLLPLLRLAPTALRDLRRPDGPRLAGLGEDFPRDLLTANRRGMLHGPRAYLRGRRMARST